MNERNPNTEKEERRKNTTTNTHITQATARREIFSLFIQFLMLIVVPGGVVLALCLLKRMNEQRQILTTRSRITTKDLALQD